LQLFSPLILGALELPNRIVMAPMTRSRAVGDGLPHPAAGAYYAQRASAGLIITEGAQISYRARGYVRTPGIHTPGQVERWREVTSAVHARGGRIFLQLWHVGRVSHQDFQNGAPPIAPSPIQAEGDAFTETGPKPVALPRGLEIQELPALAEEFASAARNAMAAGFDGVELHGANGYLLDQFIRDGSNRRTDAYGGSPANRARFPLEVVEAVGAVCGPERVGYRISPQFSMYSMSDSDSAATFTYLASALNGKAAYLHVIEPIAGPAATDPSRRITSQLRKAFRGALIANGGYDRISAEACLADGRADLVAFGLPFIANPDLPVRLAKGAPLAEPNPDTVYMGEEQGYVDYPALADG